MGDLLCSWVGWSWLLHGQWLQRRLGVDGVHLEAEEDEVGPHLGGLVNLIHRVEGARGHLTLHVDQACFTLLRRVTYLRVKPVDMFIDLLDHFG